MRQTVQSLLARRGGVGTLVGGLVRRMRVTASSAIFWTLQGFVDQDATETDEAEVFPGIGFYARPKPGDQAEVVLLKVGGDSDHSVIVATRNQDGIRRIGELGDDETIIFNSTSVVKVTAAGEIQAGAIGGPFAALATKADIDALKSWAQGHTHFVATTGTAAAQSGTSQAPLPTPPSAVGTQRLKAQ